MVLRAFARGYGAPGRQPQASLGLAYLPAGPPARRRAAPPNPASPRAAAHESMCGTFDLVGKQPLRGLSAQPVGRLSSSTVSGRGVGMWDTVFPVSTGVDSDCARSLSRVVVLSMVAITFVLGAAWRARRRLTIVTARSIEAGAMRTTPSGVALRLSTRHPRRPSRSFSVTWSARTARQARSAGACTLVSTFARDSLTAGSREYVARHGGRRVSFYGATPAPDPGARLISNGGCFEVKAEGSIWQLEYGSCADMDVFILQFFLGREPRCHQPNPNRVVCDRGSGSIAAAVRT